MCLKFSWMKKTSRSKKSSKLQQTSFHIYSSSDATSNPVGFRCCSECSTVPNKCHRITSHKVPSKLVSSFWDGKKSLKDFKNKAGVPGVPCKIPGKSKSRTPQSEVISFKPFPLLNYSVTFCSHVKLL